MAEVFLVPNGDDAGWDAGGWADVDDGGIAPSSPGSGPTDADYLEQTTGGEGVTIDLDLSAHGITDADTITAVDVYVRAYNNGGTGNDNVLVDWLIGGTPQGTQYNTGTLTGSPANYVASGSTQAWNADYTASQLDGAQVRLTSAQSGMPTELQTRVTEVEVRITYTPASTGLDFVPELPDEVLLRTRTYGGGELRQAGGPYAEYAHIARARQRTAARLALRDAGTA